MLTRDVIHFKTTQIKMTRKKYDWGYRTLCGKKVRTGTTSWRWVNCEVCIKQLINRERAKIEHLEWALRDKQTVRSLIMGSYEGSKIE